MPTPKKSPSAIAKPKVLGMRAFEAISAVEGLKLGADSKKRVRSLSASKLTPNQKRAAVLKAYKGPSGRDGR